MYQTQWAHFHHLMLGLLFRKIWFFTNYWFLNSWLIINFPNQVCITIFKVCIIPKVYMYELLHKGRNTFLRTSQSKNWNYFFVACLLII